jgi:hypothetical protein
VPTFRVRVAEKEDIREVADWLIQDRSVDPRFARLTRAGLRGWLYRRFFVPRYLRDRANTWCLEQDGQMAGYAIVEQSGHTVRIADLGVQPGYDRAGLTQAALTRAEKLAREGEYRFVYAAPWKTDPDNLQPYREFGYELLDFYLWAFEGQVRDVKAPQGVALSPLTGNQALETRLAYLGQELDASRVKGRDLIDADFLPKRPPRQRSFEIRLRSPQAEEESQPIGYLSPRPDERHDGVLTLAVSLVPEQWGSELEAQIVGGFVSAASEEGEVSVRVIVSTTAHADKVEPSFGSLGLKREMDWRPVLFKDLASGVSP